MSRSSGFAGSETESISPRGDSFSGDTADRLKQKVSSFGEQASERVRNMADQQKRMGAERVGSIARAVRSAAGNLEGEMPAAAEFIEDAARRLEQTAGDLRDRSVDDILSDVTAFARRQPALFFGGALLAGFVLSRFLKSSPPEGNSGHSSR